MNLFEPQLFKLMEDILINGEDRIDRTGVGTISTFGQLLDIDLRLGFPIVTSKAMGLKSILSELLWFIEGSCDERRLAEILHGTRDESKTTIWSGNANADYWEPKARFTGDLGPVYGVQWRHWETSTVVDYDDYLRHDDGSTTYFGAKVKTQRVDQLQRIVDTLKNNPTDRRMILSAWNVGMLDKMALPPCHMMAQFYLNAQNELSCQMYQRSVDVFLGLPYNISSYAALTHMIAHVIGAKVGKLRMCLGDTHIYTNHVDQVKLQLSREPSAVLPEFSIKNKVDSIDKFSLSDFLLTGYSPQSKIDAIMAV